MAIHTTMASSLSPLPSLSFSEPNPPWPGIPLPPPPPPDHSLRVLMFFAFSLVLFILYYCCYPLCQSSFRRRDSRPERRGDAETGLQIAISVAQRRTVQVMIEEIKSFRYSAEELVGKNSHCCVCMDEFTAGDCCKMLVVCGHSFHRQCITPWLAINPRCPICRVPVHCRWRTETCSMHESSPTSDPPTQPQV